MAELFVFRNEREILTALSRLAGRVLTLEVENGKLAARVKTLEDRGGSGSSTIESKLDTLLAGQTLLLQQGGMIMATQAQAEQLLAEIDAATTAMAGDLNRQAATITEIDNDIDALLTRGPNEPISDALKARFEQHRDTLRSLQTDLSAKATQLEATAAKHTPATTEPTPENPPVEEPPVENPPTEEPVVNPPA